MESSSSPTEPLCLLAQGAGLRPLVGPGLRPSLLTVQPLEDKQEAVPEQNAVSHIGGASSDLKKEVDASSYLPGAPFTVLFGWVQQDVVFLCLVASDHKDA